MDIATAGPPSPRRGDAALTGNGGAVAPAGDPPGARDGVARAQM